MPKQSLQKALIFFPVFLFLLNVVTKCLYLTAQDVGLDEPFSIYHAQFGLTTLIEQLKNYNNPPLYEILLHGWIRLFGISPLAVRALPMLLAALSPVALFYFGKRFFSINIGMVSSLLLSFSSLLLFYAHDSRAYSLFLLLSILSMHFFMAVLQQKTTSLRNIALFILCSCLLIYAHYFGFFILLFQAFFLLMFYRDQILKFILYYLAVFLLYLPHAYVLMTRAGTSVAHGTWLQPPAGIESLYNMLWSFSNYPFVTVLCIILLFAGLLNGIKYISTLGNNKKIVLILNWFFIPFSGMFCLSFWVPMYIPRYLIFALPAYYILLAFCIEKLFYNQALRNSLFVVLVACFAFTSKLNPNKKQNLSGSMPLIKALKDQNTLALVFPKDFLPAFAYHYNRAYFSAISDGKEYHSTDSLLNHEHIYLLNNVQDLTAADKTLYKKILLVCYGEEYNAPGNVVSKTLEEKYPLLYHKKFTDNYSISLFKIN